MHYHEGVPTPTVQKWKRDRSKMEPKKGLLASSRRRKRRHVPVSWRVDGVNLIVRELAPDWLIEAVEFAWTTVRLVGPCPRALPKHERQARASKRGLKEAAMANSSSCREAPRVLLAAF